MSCSDMDMPSFVSITDVPEDVGFPTFFWHIFCKRKCTDVEFGLQDPDAPTFSAHKMVLSLWSPYFADKFYEKGKMKETVVNIVQIDDVDPEAFGTMLKFMYGYIPELDNHRKACELYKVAIRFQVTSLMKSCRRILNETEVVPSNVFNILEASEYMENQSLTDRCMNLMQENTLEVIEAYDLPEISSSMLHTFLDLPKLSLACELDLLMWVFAWGKNKYLENSEYDSIRDALTEFLPKLHFLSLRDNEFATLYNLHQDFFSQDEALTIFVNIGVPGSKAMPDWYDENHPVRVYTGSRE